MSAASMHPRLAAAFAQLDPSDAAPVLARAPGRVNLIGEHTDYNGGFALPVAIDRACHVALRPRTDGQVRVVSADEGDAEPYVRAVMAAVDASGGYDVAIASDVPLGAGLSSSAALEVAIATAIRPDMEPRELAAACQRAEQEVSGVPGAITDQLVSVAGQQGHALLVDGRDLTWRQVRIPDDVELLVVHSGVRRRLAGADYAARRASCEAAAERLGLESLRDATLDQVQDDRIARHVVTENQRVLDFVAALEDDDLRRAGRLLDAAHDSLSQDFRVSLTEVDALAAELRSAGAIGARLTGGGFGGCVVALLHKGDATRIAGRVIERYEDRTGLEATPYRVMPSAGASIVD